MRTELIHHPLQTKINGNRQNPHFLLKNDKYLGFWEKSPNSGLTAPKNANGETFPSLHLHFNTKKRKKEIWVDTPRPVVRPYIPPAPLRWPSLFGIRALDVTILIYYYFFRAFSYSGHESQLIGT